MKAIDWNAVPTVPAHKGNVGPARRAEQIKYLVYHYTGNDGDTAMANARYYAGTAVQSSAHYFVDDQQIVRSVPDLVTAWAVGGKKWADCPKTGGGKLYGVCTNANSISIEMCDTKKDGWLMASPATQERALALGRALMAKYHIPIERVVRHFDVTGKHCPAYFMEEKAWAAFKSRLAEPEREEEPEMKMYHYINEMPAWAQAAAEKAVRNGYARMNEGGAVSIYECNLQPLVWMDRAGLLDRPAAEG